MPTPLNILIVEDSKIDAELLVYELSNAGFESNWKRVETEVAYLAGLDLNPDIIFSDFSLPQFSTTLALELLKKSGLDIPFIIVSGTIGEERAVESVRAGATDYLLKDRLKRIGPVVERALKETKERAERKLAEAALRASEQRFALALQGANDGIWDWNLETDEAYLSPRWKSMLGYSDHELENRLDTWKHLIHPEDLKTALALVSDFIEGRAEKFEVEFRMRHKDGHYLHILSRALFYDAGGKVRRLVGTHVDISERKRTEGVLRESERRFREMLENVTLIAMTLDKNGRVTFCNDYLLQLTGWKREEIIGADWFSKFIPEANQAIKKMFFDTLEAGKIPSHYEHPIKSRQGEVREIVWNNTMLRDEDGSIIGTASLGEDVTERKRLEAQLRQTQKMEAIGQLAGGVAHDFNNILAVIQLQAGLMKQEHNLTPMQMDFAIEIEKAAQRAANLTRQLLLFGRRETLQPRDLDLNEIISHITKMLQRILGEDIHMQFKYASQPLFLHADAGMMDQVLMNLAINSRDAMPNGGSLVIETSSVEFDEYTASLSTHARPGSFVCLSVSDTGCGIPPEALPRIFEPFFTTKDVGKGTGLGLATIFGIVQQHQGWISVDSEPGLGAMFRVYLPRLTRPAEKKSAAPSLASSRGGSETILLVEDDPSVRVVVRSVLSRLGYRIIEAPTGISALEVSRQNRDEIRLLLTDLVLPDGMNGKELATRLLQENPQLKIIYTSGYSTDIAGKDLPLEDGVNFLAKPFETHKLAQTVRARLDS